MVTEHKVIEVSCVDDSTRERGVTICTQAVPFKGVTLIFNKAIPHKQTDELRDLLRKMGLSEVWIQS